MSFFDNAKQTYATNTANTAQASDQSQAATNRFLQAELPDASQIIYQKMKEAALKEFEQSGHLEYLAFEHTLYNGSDGSGNLAEYSKSHFDFEASLDETLICTRLREATKQAFRQLVTDMKAEGTRITTNVSPGAHRHGTGVWFDGFNPLAVLNNRRTSFEVTVTSNLVRFAPPITG